MFNAATKTFVVQNVHPVGQAHIEIMQIEWENTWSHSRKAFFVVRCLLFEFLDRNAGYINSVYRCVNNICRLVKSALCRRYGHRQLGIKMGHHPPPAIEQKLSILRHEVGQAKRKNTLSSRTNWLNEYLCIFS